MELLRNYTAVIESVVTNGVAFVETDLHPPRKAEDIIALHKHLAEMDLRFATGIRKAGLERDIARLDNTKTYPDMISVRIIYSGTEIFFYDVSTAERVALMLSEVDRRERIEREADIRTVIIESMPKKRRFIGKVLNFISGGYYY